VVISWAGHELITAARTFAGPEIEELDKELTSVIEDFDRAVNLETLHRAMEADKRTKEAGKHLILNGIIVQFSGLV
jgi:hypothetical protein